MAVPNATRFAIFSISYNKCAWCHRPLTFDEMEVDHLIADSLSGDALAECLRLHGLPASYDVQDEANLVASCGRCNGIKGARPMPNTPIISLLLARTGKAAPSVRAMAEKFTTDRSTQKALAVLAERLIASGDEQLLDAIAAALTDVRDQVEQAAPGTTEIELDPAHRVVLQPGMWRVVGQRSDELFTVVDDRGRGGYTGRSSNFACPNCGHHGPWNGVICQSCGAMSDPAD